MRPQYELHLLNFSALLALLIGIIVLMIWIASPSATLNAPKVALPKFHNTSATNIPSLSKNVIILTITRKPEFFLNGKPVIAEYLKPELSLLKNQVADPILYLKADNALPGLWIVWVSLQLKALEFNNVYLAVNVSQQPHERVVPVQFPEVEHRFEGDVETLYPKGK